MGRDSSVGIATRYDLEGPGIESLWEGEIFRSRPDQLTMGTESFSGVKRPRRGVDHPTPSSAVVKERV